MTTFKPNHIATTSPYFRENTAIPIQKVAYKFDFGGVGDFISWVKAIQYAIESIDYTEGFVVTPPYFADLAKLWFKKYEPRFKVHVMTSTKDEELRGYAIKAPNAYDNVDSLGQNLMKLGFMYYLNLDQPPKGWDVMPKIHGNETDISKFNLPKRYAVITTAATAEVRRLPSKTINEIIDHCVKLGITPVFLGKKELASDYKASDDAQINFSFGIDLRERTGLLDAACLIAHAEFICGLDNGLLHLGMCSRVPVVMAFTTVDPKHRLAKREGDTYVIVPPEELKCRFCQSNMRGLPHHDFRKCLYGDRLCCSLITSEGFIKIIDTIVERGNHGIRRNTGKRETIFFKVIENFHSARRRFVNALYVGLSTVQRLLSTNGR